MNILFSMFIPALHVEAGLSEGSCFLRVKLRGVWIVNDGIEERRLDMLG